MPPKSKLSSFLADETLSLEEAAGEFGCTVTKLRADLRKAGAAVIGDRVAIKAIIDVMREGPKALEPSDVGLLRQLLLPYGIRIAEWKEGRTLSVVLAATGEPRLLFSDLKGSGEAPYQPVTLTRDEHLTARVYFTGKMHASAARFAPSKYQSDAAPDLFLFLCREPARLWLCRREELRDFEIGAKKKRAIDRRLKGSVGFWLPPGKRAKGEPRDALRLWFSPDTGDLDLSRRVHDSGERRVRAEELL